MDSLENLTACLDDEALDAEARELAGLDDAEAAANAGPDGGGTR